MMIQKVVDSRKIVKTKYMYDLITNDVVIIFSYLLRGPV
jgi:hypothetical protein